MAYRLPAFRDNWVITPSPKPGGLGASLLIRHLAHNLSGMNCPTSSYAAVGIALVWCTVTTMLWKVKKSVATPHFRNPNVIQKSNWCRSNMRDRHVKVCMCSINLSTVMLQTKWLPRKWITIFWDVAKFRYFIVLLRYSQHGVSQKLVSQNIMLTYMQLQFPNAELVRKAFDPIFFHLTLSDN